MAMREIGPGALLVAAVARDWWMVLARGLAAIAFGIVCFLWPGITVLALVLLWGAYAVVDGIGAIVWGARSRWWSMALVGAISVAAGLIAFFWPGITALALLYLIAAWAVVRGVVEIVAAVSLRKQITNEWMLAVAGILSIVFGALVAAYPGAGALSVVWVIGLFSIAFGITAVALALRLRTLQRELRARRAEVPVGAATSEKPWDENVR